MRFVFFMFLRNSIFKTRCVSTLRYRKAKKQYNRQEKIIDKLFFKHKIFIYKLNTNPKLVLKSLSFKIEGGSLSKRYSKSKLIDNHLFI